MSKELFLSEELKLSRKTRVLDVGANPLNRPPYADLLDHGQCELFGFEPQKDAFEKLQAEPKENRTYFNVAVGNGGHKTLNVTSYDGFTSLFKPYRPTLRYLGRFVRHMRVVDQIGLDLVRLDDLDQLPLVDLLKIDVQGAEKDIIQSGAQKLQNCVAIILETRFLRLYHHEPMIGEMDVFLRDLGFILHKFIAPKSVMIRTSQDGRLRPRRAGSQLLDGDAVYIRDLSKGADISDDALKHLAMCAASVFESYDLALSLMDTLVARGAVSGTVPERFLAYVPEELKR